MAARWQKIGIVAGGGQLPITIAQGCAARGEAYFVIRLRGYADDELSKHPGVECSIAEVGKILKSLKDAGCDAVAMGGLVGRPNFADLRPDWRGATLLPKVVAAARKGDGALLDVLVETFAADGFTVVGPEEVGGQLKAPAGILGECVPDTDDWSDLRKASSLVQAIGPFDVGQGAVVRNGLVLAIEAAEGTDQMLRRVAALPEGVKGDDPGHGARRRGVLLKRPKPGQELRVDLPTIGLRTVNLAAEAGLAGIAVMAGQSIIVDHADVVAAANKAGLWIVGTTDAELTIAQ